MHTAMCHVTRYDITASVVFEREGDFTLDVVYQVCAPFDICISHMGAPFDAHVFPVWAWRWCGSTGCALVFGLGWFRSALIRFC